MKNIIPFFIILFLMQSCHSKELKIDYKTLEINIPGSPGPWLKHHSKYYCYFGTDNDKFSSSSHQYFYILDSNGKIDSNIPVPAKLQTIYYDLYVKNDSIFTTAYDNHDTFYLDEKNKKWIETKKESDLVYKDKSYTIYARDFGEWGGVTWFEDNVSKKQYELGATNPVINKLKNSYYLTTSTTVLKIPDPKNLEGSKEPYTYEKAVLAENNFRKGSYSSKGAIIEYKNENDSQSKVSIATSFIANDKLYHVYTDNVSTKIGTLQDKKLIDIYNLKSDILPLRSYYNVRNRIQNDNYQTIQFKRGKNTFGIIEIDKDQINVVSFKNTYKEPVMGEDNAKIWIEKNFDYFYSNLHNLTLKQVDNVEQKENAKDLTQSHKISHYLLDGKNIETPRIYRKIESPSLHIITMYYYTPKEKSIELIEFGWTTASNFESVDEAIGASKIDSQKLYKSKFDWLYAFLMTRLGKPVLDKHNDKDATVEWKNGNKSVNLYFSEYDCSLTFFKS